MHGRQNIGARLAVVQGRIPVEALDPADDWPELHANFDEMLARLYATLPDRDPSLADR